MPDEDDSDIDAIDAEECGPSAEYPTEGNLSVEAHHPIITGKSEKDKKSASVRSQAVKGRRDVKPCKVKTCQKTQIPQINAVEG